MKFKTDGAYRGNIVLPEGFIRSDMRQLSEGALKVYLASVLLAHGKTDSDLERVAEMVGMDLEHTISALQVLEKQKLVSLSSSTVKILSPAVEEVNTQVYFKEYTPEEIAQMDDADITMLIQCAEKAFGKLLSYGEISVLVSLYRWIGIAPAVLVILIEYAASLGKKSMGYLKTMALEWNEKEIDSPAKAHAHITYLEQQKDYYAKMRMKLGIFGREFTKKEKEYLDAWKEKFTPDEIKEAYEKAVDNTGKISFAYANKLLNSDETTVSPVSKSGKPAKRVVASKFNNFTQKPKDYESVKAKAREKLKKLTENL